MKKVNNLFEKLIDYNNITYADENARRGKARSYGVIRHDKHKETNLKELQTKFINLTYTTSEYFIFKIYEPKEREIYRLPYYPDRIAHHALMNVLEPVWEKIFIHNSYACRKNKGIHKAVVDIKRVLRKDKENTKYCLKLDIRKFYPSIDHEILKSIIRKKIKDTKILVILDEIIDSAPGVPIGNYLSQYFANLYLTYFDHWIKEVKHIKYYFRYADDIIIFNKDKTFLHNLRKEIQDYLKTNLKLELKHNWQVFPVDARGIDFVGYKFYHTHTLLRKSMKKRLLKSIHTANKYPRDRKYIRRKLCSYAGWLKYCDSINFCRYHIDPICKKYELPTPEHIICRQTIITNILDKKLKILDHKFYDKYFKLYVLINKPIVVKSKSISLIKMILALNICKIHFNKTTRQYENTL